MYDKDDDTKSILDSIELKRETLFKFEIPVLKIYCDNKIK